VQDANRALPNVVAETDGSGAITSYYVYGLGLLSKVLPDGTAYYYHFDSRGSTVALTDAFQTVTDAYAYDPFGEVVAENGTTPNPFRYLGRHGVMDDGNGSLQVRARYYLPEAGRFITKDSLTGSDGDSQSLHRYVYAVNNPIKLIDISGFSPSEGKVLGAYTESSDNDHNHLVNNMQEINSGKSDEVKNILIKTGTETVAKMVISTYLWSLMGDIGGALAGNIFFLKHWGYDVPNEAVNAIVAFQPVIKDLHETPKGNLPKTWGGQSIRAVQCNFDETCLFGK
jgi:RHS repeat-associated protein